MQLKPPAGVNRVVENGCLDGMGLMGNRRGDGGLGGGGRAPGQASFCYTE